MVEGESQEGGEQEDDEDGLGDDLEEEYDEDDEEAALLAAIQRERKMQVQLKGVLRCAQPWDNDYLIPECHLALSFRCWHEQSTHGCGLGAPACCRCPERACSVLTPFFCCRSLCCTRAVLRWRGGAE